MCSSDLECISNTQTVQSPSCYTSCEACTGSQCNATLGFTVDPTNLCNCVPCNSTYSCPSGSTSMTLTQIIVPSDINPSILSGILAQEYGVAGLNAGICSKTCIDCSNDLCQQIGVAAGTVLFANSSNLCQCLDCTYTNQGCPACPWSVTPNAECSLQLDGMTGSGLIMCSPPTSCTGLTSSECPLAYAQQPDVNGLCAWQNSSFKMQYSQFTSPNCTCSYQYDIPTVCQQIFNCDPGYICSPNSPCTCLCVPECYNAPTCPPRTCWNNCSDFTCVNCPECPDGYSPDYSYVSQTNSSCGGDQCRCKVCPPSVKANCNPAYGQYYDPVNCVCRSCTVNCTDYYGNGSVGVYVYPEVVDGSQSCSCELCSSVQPPLNCTENCTDCGVLKPVNNVCQCGWCLPSQYSGSTSTAYGAADCPLYSGQYSGNKSQTNTSCLCGLLPITPPSPAPRTGGGCPVQVECGCCPTLYLECLAQNASADFCNSTICQV